MEQRRNSVNNWPKIKIWLFRYVLAVAILAFCNRSLPTSFLPLVLQREFDEHFGAVGFSMAMYPLAALLATHQATRFSIRAPSVVMVHSYALFVMAGATLLFACCEESLDFIGKTGAAVLVLCLRGLQGVSSALYLASNTTLITRFFDGDVPYVLGMVEVAVGTGSQLGRIFGGFLYDLGGFGCPFCVLATVQVTWAVVGLSFYESNDGCDALSCCSVQERAPPETTSWLPFLTGRNCVAIAGVLSTYAASGFLDTTLPAHLEEYVGPISVSTVGVVMAIRSTSYLFSSFVCAQVMRRELAPFECLIGAGALAAATSLLIIGPISPIQDSISMLDKPHEIRLKWFVQIVSLVIMPAGFAGLFVPALPLMQSEVRHLGSRATEQVAQLFIIAMTFGEATGPIVGGEIVTFLGFPTTALLFSIPFILVFVGALMTYDRGVAEIRRGGDETLLECSDDSEVPSPMIWPRRRSNFWPGDLVDGESAFQWRRLPYAMKQKVSTPGSAPSLRWRRSYSPVIARTKPWSTAPSSAFRRYYKKPPVRQSQVDPLRTDDID